jgi:hypothetical protein
VPRCEAEGRVSFRSSGIAERMSRRIPLSPVDAQHCNSRDFRSAFGVAASQHSPPQRPRHVAGRAIPPGNRGKRAAPGWGDISDAAPRLGPARPARFNLIPVSGQQDVTRTRSPRSRLGVRLVRLPSGHLACARNRYESEKEVAGKSSAGEDIPTPLCTPEVWPKEENPSRCDHTHGQSAKRQPADTSLFRLSGDGDRWQHHPARQARRSPAQQD